MRRLAVALAVSLLSSCTDEPRLTRDIPAVGVGLAPAAQTLRDIEASVRPHPAEILVASSDATAAVEHLTAAGEARAGEGEAKLAVTRPAAVEPPAPASEPEDPYVDDAGEEAGPDPQPAHARVAPSPDRRTPPPLVPRAAAAQLAAIDDLPVVVATGIGGAGLVVSAVAMAANLESRSDAGFVVAGTALGVGLLGLATAGVLTLVHEERGEDVATRVEVSPMGVGIDVRF
jgi:hypothetical protein